MWYSGRTAGEILTALCITPSVWCPLPNDAGRLPRIWQHVLASAMSCRIISLRNHGHSSVWWLNSYNADIYFSTMKTNVFFNLIFWNHHKSRIVSSSRFLWIPIMGLRPYISILSETDVYRHQFDVSLRRLKTVPALKGLMLGVSSPGMVTQPFKPSRLIKASFYFPENRLNFPTTKGFKTKVFMKLVYQYMTIFFNF